MVKYCFAAGPRGLAAVIAYRDGSAETSKKMLTQIRRYEMISIAAPNGASKKSILENSAEQIQHITSYE